MKKILILICLLFLVGCSATPPPAPEAPSAEGEDLQVASESPEPVSSAYLCPVRLENMKYQDPVAAIAILEGWFALQDQVKEFQGTYSTELWTGVESKMHTIRYISTEGGLSTTTSFLIFFEESGWSEGLLWITEQCWLDFPE
jgi:hypothetical protein